MSHAFCLQVFDSGLLGEGALHIVAAAQARGMLQPGADIVPCKARVRCLSYAACAGHKVGSNHEVVKQLELLEPADAAAMVIPPDDYFSPIDHGWCALRDLSIQDVCELTGRTYQPSQYLLGEDDAQRMEEMEEVRSALLCAHDALMLHCHSPWSGMKPGIQAKWRIELAGCGGWECIQSAQAKNLLLSLSLC